MLESSLDFGKGRFKGQFSKVSGEGRHLYSFRQYLVLEIYRIRENASMSI